MQFGPAGIVTIWCLSQYLNEKVKTLWMQPRSIYQWNLENPKKYHIRDELKLRHFFTILYYTYQCSEVAGKVVRPAL